MLTVTSNANLIIVVVGFFQEYCCCGLVLEIIVFFINTIITLFVQHFTSCKAISTCLLKLGIFSGWCQLYIDGDNFVYYTILYLKKIV